jgi:hypothetical protein
VQSKWELRKAHESRLWRKRSELTLRPALCESSNQLELRLQPKSANTGRTVASDVDGNVGICPFKPVAGTRKSNRLVLQPVLRQTSLADA